MNSKYKTVMIGGGLSAQNNSTYYYVAVDLPSDQLWSLNLFHAVSSISDEISITPNFKVSTVMSKCYLKNEHLAIEFVKVAAEVVKKRYKITIPLQIIQVEMSETDKQLQKQQKVSNESEAIIRARIDQSNYSPNKRPKL